MKYACILHGQDSALDVFVHVADVGADNYCGSDVFSRLRLLGKTVDKFVSCGEDGM
jgi:hypothetical protein